MNLVLHPEQPPKRSRKKKELYKLLIARSDVTASIRACEQIQDHVSGFDDPLYYPLFAAVVVCYARPFTNNEPYGALGNRWSRYKDQRCRSAHRQLMDARNELIAHSDMNVRRAEVVPPGVRFARNDDGSPLYSEDIGVRTSTYYLPLEFFSKALLTCRTLGASLNERIDVLVEELYGGLDLPSRPFPLRIDEGLQNLMTVGEAITGLGNWLWSLELQTVGTVAFLGGMTVVGLFYGLLGFARVSHDREEKGRPSSDGLLELIMGVGCFGGGVWMLANFL